MEKEQTLKIGYDLGKSIPDFLNIYSRFLISYTVAIFFVFFGIVFFAGSVIYVLPQIKLIFLGLSLMLFLVSYLIHRTKITRLKALALLILGGNVFGFLFNLVYFIVKTGRGYGHQLTFGGIEKFIFYTKNAHEGNMIEAMYGFIGGMIFIILLSLIVSVGLTAKDKFVKEGKHKKALLSVAVSIVAAFGLFLLILLYLTVYKSVTYFIAGSMLFIYGKNLFTKNSNFLKF